jgi:hypothetical protein
MTIGREARRRERHDSVSELFGERRRDAALDLLELLEFAWHDCYSEITPPDEVIDDVLVLSQGDLSRLISSAHLALSDWRDARVAADRLRG